MTVDEYVRTKVPPEFQATVARLRELMHELAPDAGESMSCGMPTYKVKRIVTYILPTKKDITFSFTYGAKFARYLKFKKPGDIDRKVVGCYLRQALELDRQRP